MSSNGTTVSEQIERLALAGFLPPAGDKLERMVEEWGKQLERYDPAVLEAGLDFLITRKKDRWWPTLAEVLEAIRAAAGPVPERSNRCPKCDGSSWVDAAPFKQSGQVYAGVQRCPECGVPPPMYEVKRGSRQALTAQEQRTMMAQRATPPVLTEAQFFAKLREMGAERLAAQLEAK